MEKKYVIHLKKIDPIIRYLGSASMMWMDLYDPSGGLYLASYDKTLIMTDLEVKKIYHGINALILSLKKIYLYSSWQKMGTRTICGWNPFRRLALGS